jgi:hypothetical protein
MNAGCSDISMIIGQNCIAIFFIDKTPTTLVKCARNLF